MSFELTVTSHSYVLKTFFPWMAKLRNISLRFHFFILKSYKSVEDCIFKPLRMHNVNDGIVRAKAENHIFSKSEV